MSALPKTSRAGNSGLIVLRELVSSNVRSGVSAPLFLRREPPGVACPVRVVYQDADPSPGA